MPDPHINHETAPREVASTHKPITQNEWTPLNIPQHMALPWYSPASEALKNQRLKARAICRDYNKNAPNENSIELATFLGKAGRGCNITPPFFCDYGKNIYLEENVYFNYNCHFLDCASISFGRNTLVGPSCHFMTAIHPLDAPTRNTGIEEAKPITVGEDCWFGGNVTVLPGITIGDRSVIGAGSVVTKDVPPDVVVAGNPAKVIKDLAEANGRSN